MDPMGRLEHLMSISGIKLLHHHAVDKKLSIISCGSFMEMENTIRIATLSAERVNEGITAARVWHMTAIVDNEIYPTLRLENVLRN